jgi:hypothetical protein
VLDAGHDGVGLGALDTDAGVDNIDECRSAEVAPGSRDRLGAVDVDVDVNLQSHDFGRYDQRKGLSVCRYHAT